MAVDGIGSVGNWAENSKSVKKMWGYTECKGPLHDVAPLREPGTARRKEPSDADVGKAYKVRHLQKFLLVMQIRRQSLMLG